MRKDSKENPQKKPTLPEVGQWPDKLAMPALIGGAVFTTVGFLLAFLYAGPVNGAAVDGVEVINGELVGNVLLLSQKIFYFHMPLGIASFIAIGFAVYYAIRYLRSKEVRFDTCSRICMEVGLVFVVGTMVTGDLWTRFEWGVWWTWDPRLTTYLILTLLIIAYFVLRSALKEPERRASYASVVAILAGIDVPICYGITRLVPSSLHPVIIRESGMTPDMVIALMFCMIGMMLVAYAFYRIRFRQVRIAERTQALKERLEDFE
ncbi:MAG: cytochrome c biogenesis protein CcsA [Eggerthellaceae bacterium]|nr:cytochrome c biogenesis protein CcsA [Eggerthellaceae bacterium]